MLWLSILSRESVTAGSLVRCHDYPDWMRYSNRDPYGESSTNHSRRRVSSTFVVVVRGRAPQFFPHRSRNGENPRMFECKNISHTASSMRFDGSEEAGWEDEKTREREKNINRHTRREEIQKNPIVRSILKRQTALKPIYLFLEFPLYPRFQTSFGRSYPLRRLFSSRAVDFTSCKKRLSECIFDLCILTSSIRDAHIVRYACIYSDTFLAALSVKRFTCWSSNPVTIGMKWLIYYSWHCLYYCPMSRADEFIASPYCWLICANNVPH